METEEQTCFLPCSAIGEVTSCRIETFSALYVMMIMMVIMVLRMETLFFMETKDKVMRVVDMVVDMVVVEDMMSIATIVTMYIVGQVMVKDIMVDKLIPLIMSQ